MSLPLTKHEFNHLRSFIGYGTLQANVWFVGMEEGGGGEDNIRRRLKFKRVEDCAKAHKILGIEKFHWDKKIIQRTWRGMCAIMLGLEGNEITTENIRHYQAESLGRLRGHTLLTELMPIPKPKINLWEYEKLIPQFKSSEDYYNSVKPFRIGYLKKLVKKYKPRVVICYGKKYWPDYMTLFSEMRFEPKGQFKIAVGDNKLVILTHHFVARTMNNKLGSIVSMIKKYHPK